MQLQCCSSKHCAPTRKILRAHGGDMTCWRIVANKSWICGLQILDSSAINLGFIKDVIFYSKYFPIILSQRHSGKLIENKAGLLKNTTGVLENKQGLLCNKYLLSLIKINFEKLLPYCHQHLENPIHKGFIWWW